MRVKVFLGIFAVSSCLSIVPEGNAAAEVCLVDPDLRALQGAKCNADQNDQAIFSAEKSLVQSFLSPLPVETTSPYSTPEAFQSYFLKMYDDEKFAQNVLFDLKKGGDSFALETLPLQNLTSSQRNFVLDNMGYFFNTTSEAWFDDDFNKKVSAFKMNVLQSRFLDVKDLVSDSDLSFFRRVWNSIKGAIYYMGAPGDLNMGYNLMKMHHID